MSIGFWQLIIFFLIIAAYFIPFIIALIRDVRNKVSVFFLNLFLGWTVIGFFVLLFYASLTNATANGIYNIHEVLGPYTKIVSSPLATDHNQEF